MNISFKNLLAATVTTLVVTTQMMAQTAQDGMKFLDAEKYSKAKTVFEGLAQSAATPENLFNLGNYHLTNPLVDIKAADEAFNKGNTLDPKNFLNKVGLGTSRLAAKDRAGAKLIFDEVLKLTKSKNTDLIVKIAQAYTMFDETNDPAESLRLLDLVLENKKFVATEDYYLARGKVFYIKNDGGGAMSEYEKALPFNKNVAKVRSLMGQVWVQGKNFQKAFDNFTAGIAADPIFAPTYRQMGNLYVTYKRYAEAAKNFKKYNELADTDDNAKLRYAKLAFSSQDYDAALETLNDLKSRAKDPIIYRLIGMAQIEKGQATEGIGNIQKFLAEAGESRQLGVDYGYIGRGLVKIVDEPNKKMNDSLAIVNMNKAIAMNDTSYNYIADIAGIYSKAKRYNDAAKIYQKIIDASKKPTITDYFNLGNVQSAGREWANAKTTWSKIIEMNPKYTAAYYQLAGSLRNLDTTATKASSIPMYQKFVDLNDAPDAAKLTDGGKRQMATALTYLASFAGNSNDTEKAKALFARVLTFDAANKYAKDALDKLNGVLPAVIPATTTTTTTPTTTNPPK
jgi:tetratricopeptide (TPR) repeat protein